MLTEASRNIVPLRGELREALQNVENSAARHTLLILPCLVSFRECVCLWLRICFEESGIWLGYRFAIGYALRIWALV